ncbi:MAG: CDP-diacylglycerol--glycerol-3-phosphate 3-phosphatidyltransferase [Actinobacteria bacterium]|nr:CDP-diacylglycerol--glycerol-3-phosphate 3-phosphatidyltransferase [Actinomycetota bacterium]MCB9412349.1 CDP-diacylglycerol--glycerol-3-phosphate 3-phosphatidyltransferase [Actinomycetota bacterium]
MEVQQTEVTSSRVVTLPNVLSLARLLGVPVFLWLILVPKADGWAVLLLVVAGFTDYLDGYLARKWNQITRLGQLLDPIADRLYILATLIGLLVRGIIPWWLVVLLLARDLVMAVVLALLKRVGVTGLPVHFIGKAATFNLLYAFPLLLLGDGTSTAALVARVFGWAFVIWGTALYWWAAVLYFEQARRILRSRKAVGR